MKVLVFLLCLSVLMVGCATSGWYWVKAGATQAEFDRDHYQCRRDARGSQLSYRLPSGLVLPLPLDLPDEGWYMTCMEAQGYSRVAQ